MIWQSNRFTEKTRIDRNLCNAMVRKRPGEPRIRRHRKRQGAFLAFYRDFERAYRRNIESAGRIPNRRACGGGQVFLPGGKPEQGAGIEHKHYRLSPGQSFSLSGELGLSLKTTFFSCGSIFNGSCALATGRSSAMGLPFLQICTISPFSSIRASSIERFVFALCVLTIIIAHLIN